MISTRVLYDAITFYANCGFVMIDVPLLVDVDISNHTKPVDRENIHHNSDKVYVASAEQSFLQLHKEGRLPHGKFMALTPCCRDEAILDAVHYKTFLKLELIVVGRCDINDILLPVKTFFGKSLKNLCIEDVGGVLDIVSNGVELGSYGVRQFLNSDELYTFGTGVAEPRFSYCLSKE